MKLYAFQPKGHGDFSFFVVAKSEVEARQSVDKYIAEHLNKDDDLFITDYSVKSWNDDNYYTLTVADIGEVIINCND